MALSDWVRLGGKSQRYKNRKTGEEISRRQYDKLKSPLSYEARAKHNKLLNPGEQLLRPARGRKSYRRAPEWQRAEILEQRKAQKAAREKEREAKKQTRKIERDTKRLENKKIRVRSVKKHLIPKGRIAWRIPFKSYSDLIKLINDARATGVIFAYGLGMIGVDTRIGVERPIWVVPYMSIKDTISEREFDAVMQEALDAHSYMTLGGYFIQLAIDKNFAFRK